MARFLFALFTCCAFSACSSITMNMSSTRFISPESGSIGFETGVQGVNHVTIVPDAGATPPSLHSPYFSGSDVGYFLGANFGIIPRIDFTGSLPVDGVPTAGLKIQLIGPTYREEKAKSFSLSITGAAGHARTSGKDGTKWAYERKAYSEDASIVMGIRGSKYVLFYGGPFATWYQVKGSINQPSDNASAHLFSGRGTQRGFNLGIQMGRGGYLKTELAIVEGKYNGRKRIKLDGGLVVGFQF